VEAPTADVISAAGAFSAAANPVASVGSAFTRASV
jgi:hypothetical protein